MQCDLWFPPADIPLGHGQVGSPPVLVMTAGYSRVLDAVMIPTRTAEDLIAGHWLLLNRFGAVPRELVWDQEGAVGRWRRGKPVLTEEFEAFRGMLGTTVRLCRPADPEAKGLVERTNDYFETSFLPGRTFTSPADFNAQLAEWLAARANARHHRALGCQPITRWATDKAAMLSLPPVAPALGWRHSVRLPRDHYVRLDTNDYSVDPRGDRPTGRGGRRPGPGSGDLRRAAGRRPRALLGRASDHHRSRARRRRGRAAQQRVARPRPPEDPHQVEVRDLGCLRPGVRPGRGGGLMPTAKTTP